LKHYDRYVLGQLMQAFGFFCLILALAYWINRSLGIFNNLIGDGQSTVVFFELILLFLPQVIAIVLPIAALAATVFVINRLNAESELIILDASGMSPLSILRPFLYFSLITAITTAILSLNLVPMSRAHLDFRKEEISKDIVSRLISDGSFLHPVENMTIFVSSVNPNGEFQDIFIHDQRSNERDLTYISTRAVLVREKNQSHLVLFNGLIQTLDLKSQTLSHVGFESFAYELTQLVSAQSKQLMNIDNYGIKELFTADNELLKVLKKSKTEVHFEAHDRLLKPFHCILYVLLSAVIMTIGGHSRVGLTRQILISIIVIAIFNVLATNGLTLLRRDSSNWFFAYLPVLIGFSMIGGLSTRMRRPLFIGALKHIYFGKKI
jgi:lipopolysaccharide export system permease protein